MNPSFASAQVDSAPSPAQFAVTLDLAALAGIGKDDTVKVQALSNRTLELFDRTLAMVDAAALPYDSHDQSREGFIPEEEGLRARFKFAEAIGSYATLNSLLDRYAPMYQLTRAITQTAVVAEISSADLNALADYRDQIQTALVHASDYLALRSIAGFSSEELRELNDILCEARKRFHDIETVLGMRLIHDVEQAVHRLYYFHEKTQAVQKTITGIFLVDSEIMFLPAAELVRIVNDIFRAIGNPFVIEHIDGTLLLAARNLLIQVVSFYSYYGREQIYQLFDSHPGTSGRARIAACVHGEIRTLFSACRTNNKLVLSRLMNDVEREFELSIESIQTEAANRAITAVERLIPVRGAMPAAKPRGLIRRLARWIMHPLASP